MRTIAILWFLASMAANGAHGDHKSLSEVAAATTSSTRAQANSQQR